MKPRTCTIRVWIANDAGKAACYSLKPLSRDDLGQSVAGFRLVKISADPAPVYAVRLAVDGQAVCNCPQHNRAGQCKHADALLAAGVLPAPLLGAIQAQSKLLVEAEAMLKETEDKLAQVSARAVQLQTALAAIEQPARPGRRRAGKSQAA